MHKHKQNSVLWWYFGAATPAGGLSYTNTNKNAITGEIITFQDILLCGFLVFSRDLIGWARGFLEISSHHSRSRHYR